MIIIEMDQAEAARAYDQLLDLLDAYGSFHSLVLLNKESVEDIQRCLCEIRTLASDADEMPQYDEIVEHCDTIADVISCSDPKPLNLDVGTEQLLEKVKDGCKRAMLRGSGYSR